MPNRRPKATRGRPAPEREISPQQIVDVALRRIRAGGFANVSMRQVADDLGITATALYNHFSSKDALLDEVAEQIYAAIPKPDPRFPWTKRLRQWLLAQEIVHLEHPGIARFLLARHAESTAAFRWLDSIFEILSEGGLDVESQLICIRRIAYLHNPLIYLDAPQREREAQTGGAVDASHLQVLRNYPHFARVAGHWNASPAQEDFERALDTAIAGMAAAVKEHQNGTARRRRQG